MKIIIYSLFLLICGCAKGQVNICNKDLKSLSLGKITPTLTIINPSTKNQKILTSIRYIWGIGVRANRELAESMLQKVEKKDLMNFITFLENEKKKGCRFSTTILGIVYFEGNYFGLNRDLNIAENFFRQNKEHPLSKIGLSAIYYIMNNKILAIKEINKLVNDDENNALSIAIMLDHGVIFEENKMDAFYWYKKAGELKIYEAYGRLGYLYAVGSGVNKNLEKSRYWFNLQAKHPKFKQNKKSTEKESIIRNIIK